MVVPLLCLRRIMNAKNPTRSKPAMMAPAIMPPFAPAESPPDDPALFGVSAVVVIVAAGPVVGVATPVQVKDPFMPPLT